MNNFVFESWKSWRVCFVSGLKKAGWGIARIITCILLGIISIFVHVWRVIVRFVGLNPKLAIGGFFVIVIIVWLLTFVSMRARAVGAEHQRDSIAWQYQDFKEKHGYDK